jgi:hypothetical protein
LASQRVQCVLDVEPAYNSLWSQRFVMISSYHTWPYFDPRVKYTVLSVLRRKPTLYCVLVSLEPGGGTVPTRGMLEAGSGRDRVSPIPRLPLVYNFEP